MACLRTRPVHASQSVIPAVAETHERKLQLASRPMRKRAVDGGDPPGADRAQKERFDQSEQHRPRCGPPNTDQQGLPEPVELELVREQQIEPDAEYVERRQ